MKSNGGAQRLTLSGSHLSRPVINLSLCHCFVCKVPCQCDLPIVWLKCTPGTWREIWDKSVFWRLDRCSVAGTTSCSLGSVCALITLRVITLHNCGSKCQTFIVQAGHLWSHVVPGNLALFTVEHDRHSRFLDYCRPLSARWCLSPYLDQLVT